MIRPTEQTLGPRPLNPAALSLEQVAAFCYGRASVDAKALAAELACVESPRADELKACPHETP